MYHGREKEHGGRVIRVFCARLDLNDEFFERWHGFDEEREERFWWGSTNSKFPDSESVMMDELN